MIPLILIPGHLCGRWLYPEGMVPDGFDVLPLADTTQDDDIGAMADRVLASASDRFAVAGLSMGGMVAMELMARAPDRILGACLMDTDPTPARPREIEWRNGLLDQGLAVYAQTFVSRFFLHDPAAPLAGVVLNHMQNVPGRIARAQARALDARRNMAPLISDFAGPVEVVVGPRTGSVRPVCTGICAMHCRARVRQRSRIAGTWRHWSTPKSFPMC